MLSAVVEEVDVLAATFGLDVSLSSRSWDLAALLWRFRTPADLESQVELKIQRRQLPMTSKAASTLHTLQGVTASPGLIFHWMCPRFMSSERRWLATYVAISRPKPLAQLISIGPIANLQDVIESGPPYGTLTRFDDMFQELELATHSRTTEVMRELGWAATD